MEVKGVTLKCNGKEMARLEEICDGMVSNGSESIRHGKATRRTEWTRGAMARHGTMRKAMERRRTE